MTLPPDSMYSELEVVGGRLYAYGELNSCEVAEVGPSTLALSPVRRFACDDWPPERRVIAVEQPIGKFYNDSAKVNAVVRIGVRSSPHGPAVLGPVVMRFGDYSDSHLETTYGDNSLWVYDCNTAGGSELLRVSLANGAVEARLAMPDICRPVIAAGPTGFWMGPASNSPGGWGLYHVIAGSRHPVLVDRAHRFVDWFVVSGGSAWADVFTPYSTACQCRHGELLRYDRNAAMPTFDVPDHGLFEGEPLQGAAVGGESVGLWTVAPFGRVSPTSQTGQDAVVRIDPNTGRWSYATKLTPIGVPSYDLGLSVDQGVFFQGRFFFLEPPYHYNGYVGASTIVRVTP